MSKLFETLEKIRQNEGRVAGLPMTAGASGEEPPARSRVMVIVILMSGIVATLLYLVLPSLLQKPIQLPNFFAQNNASITVDIPGSQKSMAAKVTNRPIQDQSNRTSKNEQPSDFVSLNNAGTERIRNSDYWKGIYYLKKALQLAPNKIEPVVNLAVAYTELGLFWKAIDYYEKAYEVDSNYELLMVNLQIVKQAGLLDSEILSEASMNWQQKQNL